MTVSPSRKELSSKVEGFHSTEYPSLMAGMKNSSKNKFLTDEKKLMVSTRHKINSTTQNEVSFKKYVCTI